jgi:formylglycine-generating enzyme required for sulfatase activity
VTVGEYQRFVEHDGYRQEEYWKAGGFGDFTAPGDWEEQRRFPSRPVTGVSWYEAAAYARWDHCRLPTEAEWEYAARGDDGREFPWGDDPPDKARMNYADDNFDPHVGHPTPVGVYPRGRSPWELDDMAGNVWEWCADWYAEYSAEAAKDPRGPSEGDRRVLRGGSWRLVDINCRASFRNRYAPFGRGVLVGFRVVFCGQDS